MISASIKTLLQKIQLLDDQKSFKQLYQLLFFRLYQFAYSYLDSKEDAEEIVNDVFLRLWEKRKILETINNINVYLYVAVKNASLNQLRKNNPRLNLSIDNVSVHHIQMVANPESLMISEEMKLAIRRAIESLPPKCKLIFKLIKEDGLSYKEVATILDISVKTVDAQLYISLKKLSLILQPTLKKSLVSN